MCSSRQATEHHVAELCLLQACTWAGLGRRQLDDVLDCQALHGMHAGQAAWLDSFCLPSLFARRRSRACG